MAWSDLDLLPVATVVVRDGIVAYANPAAAALAGLARERVVGRPFGEFVAPEELARVAERNRARLAGQPVPPVYDVTVMVQGRRRTFRLHAAAANGEIVVQLLDVTEETFHGQRLAALARFGALVQNQRTHDDVLRAVRRDTESLGLFCALVVPGREEVELRSVSTSAGRMRRWEEVVGRPIEGLVRPWTPFLRTAWEDGTAFADDWLDEASHLLRAPVATLFTGEPELHGLAARIDRAGLPWALLLVVGPWLRGTDQPAFRLFGAQVAAALEAARAIQVLSARNAELAALNRLAAASGESGDLDTLLEAGGRVVKETLGCRDLAVYLVAADRHTIELAYASGPAPELHRFLSRGTVDGPFLGLVVREGRSLVRLTEELPEPAAGVMRRDGVATLAAVPLRFRSSAIGLLITAWAERRDAAGCRLPLLEAMGTHFAAAVYSHRLVADLRAQVAENAELHAQAQRRVEELGLFLEVARSLAATLDPDQVLDAGVRNLARIAGAPEAYLLLATDRGDRLVVRACAGPHPELQGTEVPVDPGGGALASAVVTRREVVLVEDAAADPRAHASLTRVTGARGWLGLPLVVRDRAIGAVVIVDPSAPRRFTRAEVERATVIANQLAVAAVNARLYDDLRRSYAELARTQEQLVRRERLAALGELAAVVAHEVRNPLGAVFNAVGALRRILRPEGEPRMLLDIVGEEADRLNAIVGDLLDFARPSKPSIRPEPVEPLLDEVLAAALAQAAPALEVVRDVEEALPPVLADARQLRQALLNVAQNAVQAMPDGGRLTVRARQDEGAIRIEVADTGPGVPPELREKIFEPFFSTRATGTGLGLAVVRRVLQDHRGTAVVEEAPGGGTALVLRLPLDAGAPPVAGRPDLG